MNLSLHIQPHNLHHAYLLVGDTEDVKKNLLSFINHELSFPVQANPDFWIEDHETITIEKARELIDFHLVRPFQEERKFFVLSARGITVEAQNALLKLFEEPIVGNHFFLILNDSRTLLPTLRSRIQIIILKEKDVSQLGENFIKLSFIDRLKMVEGIIEEKNKGEAKSLVQSVVSAIRRRAKDEEGLKEIAPVLSDLIHIEDYFSDRAPSVKMLLEHLVFTVPQYKIPS